MSVFKKKILIFISLGILLFWAVFTVPVGWATDDESGASSSAEKEILTLTGENEEKENETSESEASESATEVATPVWENIRTTTPTSTETAEELVNQSPMAKETSFPTPAKAPTIRPLRFLINLIKSIFQGNQKLSLSKNNLQAKEEIAIVLGTYQKEELSILVTKDENEVPVNQRIEEGILKISPPRNFKPGKYKIKIKDNKTSETLIEQDFTWGVLAINTNKSVYLPNEKAKLAMAVLDENGRMVCNAKLRLEIRNPTRLPDGQESEIRKLSTEDGSIQVNPECQVHGFTMKPDYEAEYQVGESGLYEMELTAETGNGTWTINDSFEVWENVPFDVERDSATRIYPPKSYPVTFYVTANQDFEGVIEETVPVDFEISPPVNNQTYNHLTIQQSNKVISWEVSLKKGDKLSLGYLFDAPDISPQFYLLGPLQFKKYLQKIENPEEVSSTPEINAIDPTTGIISEPLLEASVSSQKVSNVVTTEEVIVFEEARQWQIAADVVANLILLWDSATEVAPTGWTCISCNSGEDFYQLYIRGNSAYGSTPGGASTHSHPDPSTLISGTGTAYGATGIQNIRPALADHTHTTTVASGLSGTNIPLSRYLKVIRYNYGIPETLPAGVIAIWDTTRPSGWTDVYNDGRYIQGYDHTNVGGTTGTANTHTHTITLNTPTTNAATQTSSKPDKKATGDLGGVEHNHPISNTGLSDSQSHEPGYMTVILSKKDSSGPIPQNMIAMFDNTPPAANWTVNSGSGQDFYQRFFKPTGTYGSSSDIKIHTHADVNITTSGPSGTTSYGGTGSLFTTGGHTHTFTVPFGAAINHEPPYRDAIFAKTSSTPAPNLEQIHYHWRNDNNDEVNATSATGGTEDTFYTFTASSNKRLRMEVSNEGGAAAADVQFRLDYGLKETTCGNIASWIDVGGGGGDWDMYGTTNLTDGDDTTNIAVATGGVTDANPTFKTDNNAVKDTSSLVLATTLTYEDFIEMEFSIKPNALTGDYCFKVTNNGSTTDFTYTRYAEATLNISANQPPNSPSGLAQKKTDDTTLNTGDWTNETSVKFTATADDPDSSDTLYLCVEKDQTGTAFSNTEDSCGTGVAYSGTPVTVTVTISSQSDNTEYHWQARVKDAASAYSSWVSYGANTDPNDRDYGIDTTAPTGGTVYDGTETGVDKDFNDGSLSQLSANWSGFDANVSGLNRYEYSIGTTQGGTDIKNWTDNLTTTSVTATSLTLQTSSVYYFNVRAVDNANSTQSPAISSDGQLVAPSLSFSVSPSSISFANLNAGNSYTDTKTATLTTSTNAYNGYVIRAFVTDYLRSTDSNWTIIDFDGGTYASPDEWLTGDRGFGYNSSDTTIQGSNKFNSTPCPGGGNPLCYAPFSQSAPGDIVADHTDNVTGSPITNEEFTITYKVKTNDIQEAANYVTTAVYTATAIY